MIIPNSEPFLLKGGTTGCLLLHGFSSTPEEMRPLGEYLVSQGYTVLGVRLAGHATRPDDLKRVHWTDWLNNVEDGLDLLSGMCRVFVLVGQSMGGMIALTAAARFQISGVAAFSTPYGSPPKPSIIQRLFLMVHPVIDKRVKRFPPDHPLYHRRELDYPAYPEVPRSIYREIQRLSKALMAAVPQITVPALLIHSRADRSVPFVCLQGLYDHLGSAQKEMLALDGMDHSLVLDPNRQVVFEAVNKFLGDLDLER
jgi:carboxylesterase